MDFNDVNRKNFHYKVTRFYEKERIVKKSLRGGGGGGGAPRKVLMAHFQQKLHIFAYC